MKIESINVTNEASVHCRSSFYTAQDSLRTTLNYDFSVGINKLIGEIDSGIWAVSYFLSMYKYRPKDFILFDEPKLKINNMVLSLNDLSRYTCYMDKLYPFFSTKVPIKKLILRSLKRNKLNCSADDIRDIFHMDKDRFERPITGVGNEIFRAMAAIGYVNGKQVYCFPWLSQERFNGYHLHLTDLIDILDKLGMIVIVPIGK